MTLARTEPGALARSGHNALADFRVLDVYTGGAAPAEARVDALATISAGEKNGNAPKVNRDGTISLHDPEGRAPGLAEVLQASGGKSLTIAFPFDDPRQFVQQRFAEYSASALLAFGDEHGLTLIEGQNRRYLQAGTDDYAARVARCKVTVSVYFTLATWGEGGASPAVVFPDGLGFYRLRFTSRNSLRNLVGSLQLLGKLSGGRLAGVPLELRLVNREVSGPDGKRRNVPVWTFTMRPPQGLTLSSANFQATLGRALEAGQALVLPPPEVETVETASSDVIDVDLDDAPEPAPVLTEREARQLTTGFDAEHFRRSFFAIASGTPFHDKPARADLLRRVTEGRTQSLGELCGFADAALADRVLVALEEAVATWRDEQALLQRRLNQKSLDRLVAELAELGVEAPLAFAREVYPDLPALTELRVFQARELKAVAQLRREAAVSAEAQAAIPAPDTDAQAAERDADRITDPNDTLEAPLLDDMPF